ncbi:MAG: helix-hairpin-helix domain-containing protein [Clostridia bacterium]|nr:helix-hairpin-helix domain-containing protein [Clostridia bacterium]MBR0414200.1 helix-hairpin-helix domain-containing protein [Clostridia bacterium]
MKSYSKQIKILAAIGIALVAAVFLVAAFSPLKNQATFQSTAVAETAQAETEAPFPVNINTASEARLQTVPQIGEKTAKAIVEYRAQHGNFTTVDDLLNVSGIGEKTLESIKEYICVDEK